MTQPLTQTIGYPRIGKAREMKRAVEGYWKGKVEADELLATMRQVEEAGWHAQLEAGVDRIGVGDATLYDHVADWAIRTGLVAGRFQPFQGLDRTFAMARGAPDVPALELTKWFDTNYHYLVPEVDADTTPTADYADFIETVRRAQSLLGERAVPIVLGPVTLLRLARLEQPLEQVLDAMLPIYRDLLAELNDLGVQEVQLHEPALVLGDATEHEAHYRRAYEALAGAGPAINLVTYFDDPGETLPFVLDLPVEIVSLDFTRGRTLPALRQVNWPAGKTLAAGIIDGRSVWQSRPSKLLPLIDELRKLAPQLRIGPSSSLQFVPYEAARETHLPEELRSALAFAEEKLREVVLFGRALAGEDVNAETQVLDESWARFRAFAPDEPEVQEKLDRLAEGDFERAQPYRQRRGQQISLPPFPTTTIGSFPQTTAVRKLRASFKRGEITEAEYQAGVDAWIGYTIGVQEGMGLDVLVHGEFERSDMVEYFAEKLHGFAFTQDGWVQSYGSRYVRPPIIYADVVRPGPMTVREFQVAQSFTEKPVKGMLTGPVTILNWSYPRIDIPRQEIAYQIALALQEEIVDLEAAGALVVQVDEPALREGLPFKPDRWDEYLSWAVDAFRLATARAEPQTQVHTHMCYAEFGDVLGAIDRLNADVISIENARSGDETLRELAAYGYEREVGPGVYDVHSPVVPDREQVKAKLRTFLRHLEPGQVWVNPDCGLKTRGWGEVIPALTHITEAVNELRRELEAEKQPAAATD